MRLAVLLSSGRGGKRSAKAGKGCPEAMRRRDWDAPVGADDGGDVLDGQGGVVEARELLECPAAVERGTACARAGIAQRGPPAARRGGLVSRDSGPLVGDRARDRRQTRLVARARVPLDGRHEAAVLGELGGADDRARGALLQNP